MRYPDFNNLEHERDLWHPSRKKETKIVYLTHGAVTGFRGCREGFNRMNVGKVTCCQIDITEQWWAFGEVLEKMVLIVCPRRSLHMNESHNRRI